MTGAFIAAALALALVVVAPGAVVGQVDPDPALQTPQPLIFGGRVEMPEAGFALTFPDDWLAAPTATGDIVAVLALADATPEYLSALRTDWAERGFVLVAAPRDVEADESCIVASLPSQGRAPAEWMGYFLGPEAGIPNQRTQPHLGRGPRRIPRGRREGGGGTSGRAELVALRRRAEAIVLTCSSVPTRPDGGWHAIAESFEFLPAD